MRIEIVFETHSLSTDNESGIATGWLDGRLSERGKGLARELGERRRDVDVVFTSDLGRAAETAQIGFEGTDVPIYRDWRLRECNYGHLNGMPVSRLETERMRHIDDPFPGGESYRQVVERMRGFLDDLALSYGEARILVIGHSATRWAIDHLLNGEALEELVAAPFAWQEGWIYLLPSSPPAGRHAGSPRRR
jgi:2,3-bisphosphoglycerate-dependent phosphoglycerate mutase